jgi:acyl carrier protein
VISEQIKKFLQTHPVYRHSMPAELKSDFSLIESGILDSIGIFELIVFLEDEFNIRVTAAEIVENHFRDLISITAFVQRKQRTSAAAP